MLVKLGIHHRHGHIHTGTAVFTCSPTLLHMSCGLAMVPGSKGIKVVVSDLMIPAFWVKTAMPINNTQPVVTTSGQTCAQCPGLWKTVGLPVSVEDRGSAWESFEGQWHSRHVFQMETFSSHSLDKFDQAHEVWRCGGNRWEMSSDRREHK